MKNTTGKKTTLYEKETALGVVIDEFQKNDKIVVVFLFGSFARGTAAPDSDIDLLVITEKPFHKEVKEISGVEFEVFCNNKEDTVTFWRENLDDFTNFIKDAKLIFGDKEVIEYLEQEANQISPNFKHFHLRG